MRIRPGDEDLVAEFFNNEDVIVYNCDTDVWVGGNKLSPDQYAKVLDYKKEYVNCPR